MSIGSRIKQRREELGLTQPELANLIGVSKGSIGNYESNVSSPNEKILFKLFSALKCDANFLYQDDMKIMQTDNFTFEEKKHIKKYRELDTHGRDMVDTVIEKEYERCMSNEEQEEEKPDVIEIKLAQLPASAGTGVELYEENYQIMSIRASDLARQADFAVKVSGDSMETTFYDGDILLIESMPFINKGDIGIFVVNGDGYVKEYGGDRLISHNEKYPDIKLTEHDVVICSGRVIGALEENDFID